MKRYLVRRIAVIPFLMLGIITMVFIVSRLTPADPLVSIVGARNLNNPTIVAAAKARWGLDQSIPIQYLKYMKNVFQGDLGTSFTTRKPVLHDLWDRLPATLELTSFALVIGVVGGVGLGVLAARHRNTIIDHVARFFALLGSSLPAFWAGLLGLYVLYSRLEWLPGPGRLDPRADPPARITGFFTVDALLHGDMSTFWSALRHLILPACVLGWGVIGIVSRLVRASLLDEFSMEYVRVARAMGLRERTVVNNHALRNALLPTITIVGFSFAYLITGAVLTEIVFSWPGLGSYAVEASRKLDFPAVIGVSALGGLAFLLTNLITDIAYAIADPRIRLS
ncbi:MAG: peptide transporter permease [Ilumatobacteraceae bacterium]|nr:peptide transporter permease [Ilumatobacteraceae bacterium]